jgi:dolichol-phosphate mannosyltransferase
MPRILVFTATYEEAANIHNWVQGVRSAAPEAHLLVVDDSSPDGTGDILDSLAAGDAALTVVHRPGKSGLASAHLEAMRYALHNDYEVLVTMDADGSHLPEQVPSLIQALPGHDFVIGTRYRGGRHKAGLFRRTLSAGANGLSRLVLPTGLSEYTTSFRAFDRQSLDVLVHSDFTTGGYAFFVECIEILYQAGLSLTETPIDFVDRMHGSSKIPKGQVFMSITALGSMGWRRMKRISS